VSETSFGYRAAVSAGANHFYSGLIPFFGSRCEETWWAGGPCRISERAGELARAAGSRSPAELNKLQPVLLLGRRCRLSRQRQPPSTTDVRSTDTRTPAHPPRTSKPPLPPLAPSGRSSSLADPVSRTSDEFEGFKGGPEAVPGLQ
jgi:hypothetical protein